MNLPGKNRQSGFLWLSAIIVLTVVAYIPVFNAGFTNWDDQLYILENRFIRQLSADNIRKFFSSYFVGNYHPFTMLSLAFDYAVAGTKPFWYHVHNLLLHLLNTLLVFWFVRLLTKKQLVALLVALLFGIHTMHVESVAWIAERKDVLYTFYFLLSAIFYIKYLIARTGHKKYLPLYLLSLGFFLFSLFSKGQAVTLAIVIMLTDYLFGREFRKPAAWLDKIPFLLIALTFGIIALYAQKSAAAFPDTPNHNLIESLVLATYNISVYLAKLIMPLHLSTFYPLPDKVGGHLPWIYWFFVPVLILLLFGIIYNWKKNPKLVFGLMFFLVNVALVLQVIPVGGARIADRYVYVASIGVFFIIAMEADRLKEKFSQSNKTVYRLLIVLFVCWAGLLSVLTFQRSKVWNNSLVLWTDVLQKFPGTQRAYINRGNGYFEAGRLQEAIADYNIVLARNPTDVTAYINRGRAKANMGDMQGAINDLSACTRLMPNDYLPHYNLGILYAILGEKMQSYNAFSISIKLNPEYAEAYFYRAQISVELGYKDQICIDYRRALDLGYQQAAAELKKYCN
jgi:Tfp pilus assembly protein PilF